MDYDNLENDPPAFSAEDKFCFGCGPAMPCFNRCCAQLSLPLTPYDVMRLSRNLGLKSGDFLRTFTGRRIEPSTGFPMFSLRMIESPDAPCPFVTPAGCSVYDDRPGACRSYPLGRGARLSADGVAERLFMVREEHCCGFEAGPEWTAAQWFADQGLESYNYFNDRYMRLMSLIAASGRPLEKRLSGIVSLCLWETELIPQFIDKMNIFAQLELTPEKQSLLLGSGAASDEARLDFGMSLLELIIFGCAPDLERKR